MSDLAATICKVSAEACGICVAEALGGKDDAAIEARQLTMWLLHALTERTVKQMGLAINREEEAARRILSSAHSKRRRDPVWRAKGDRLLDRMRDEGQEEPEQLDLLMPGDIPQEEHCSSWGFEEPRGKRYFLEMNERFARALQAGLAQEAKEREDAA